MIVEQEQAQPGQRFHRQRRFLFSASGDLLLLLGGALLLPILVLLPIPLLRLPFGITLVLFAPGYALTAALFAHRDDLDLPARLALAFGLSVAMLPVFALVLDALPWGIRLWPIVVALMSWIVLLAGIATIRRIVLGQAAATLTPGIAPQAWWSRQTSRRKGTYLLVPLVLIGFGIWGGMAFTAANATVGTSFYALGPDGLAENYPRDVAPGALMQVQLGIQNREGAVVAYRVEVRAGSTPIAALGPITVADNATWEQPLRYKLPNAADDQRIDILLFRADDTIPYRTLQLWVNVKEPLP